MIALKVYYHLDKVGKVITRTYNFLSVTLNVTFFGVSTFSLAFIGGSALGLAFLAVYAVILVRTQFSDQVEVRVNQRLITFSKNFLNVLMEEQFQDLFTPYLSLLSGYVIFWICIWCFSCNICFVFKTFRICYGFCIIINNRRIITKRGIKRRIIRFIFVMAP